MSCGAHPGDSAGPGGVEWRALRCARVDAGLHSGGLRLASHLDRPGCCADSRARRHRQDPGDPQRAVRTRVGPVVKLSCVHLREEVRRWRGAPVLDRPRRRTWIVQLETDCGATAAGEIAWLPRHGPEPDIPALVETWARGWLGRALPDAFDDPALPTPVAWAVTTALASLQCVWPTVDAITENGLLHADTGSAEAVARLWSAHIAARPHIRTWKIKVGRLPLAEDLARLCALTLPPGVRLRLDPNRKWGDHDPHAVRADLADLPIEYIEEPVSWPALEQWARAGVPCAADESVATVDVDTLAAAGICALVVKPSTVGGMGAVRAMLQQAADRGLDVVLSSSLEGPVGRAHLEALACMLPKPQPAAGLARETLEEAPEAVPQRERFAADDDPLHRAALRFPDAVAIECEAEQMTFAEWDRAADVAARALGARTGARLAVEIAGIEGAVRFFAVMRAGGIACLVPPGPGREAATEAVGVEPWGPGTGRSPGVQAARPATILWSSGSRGTPRAIVHSLGQHMSSAAASHVHTPFGQGDRWVASLRMHHVGGLALLFRALVAGGTVVFPGARPLRALGATHLSWVPTQLVRDAGAPPDSLRHLLLGGAAAPPGLVARKRAQGWPVKTTYGSTELASQVCTSTVDGAPEESGAPLAGRLVTADPGIRVRGTTTSLGTWGPAGIEPIADPNGWYATGDLGRITAQGTLQVMGRADTMFISGGENVFPETIERVLGAHPDVRRVVVVDVPDAVWGARPWAFIDGELDLHTVRTYLQGRLPRHAWVDRVLPWDNAGVGTTGKPLRAWFRAAAHTLSRAAD
ncbi:MAG: hypothetical protein CL927_20665 [Deltaproteobacteria bacterium]|nr:hypothetical protein [Deltaproteobacteria bacterium]